MLGKKALIVGRVADIKITCSATSVKQIEDILKTMSPKKNYQTSEKIFCPATDNDT